MAATRHPFRALRRALFGTAAVLVILLAVGLNLFRVLVAEIPSLQKDIEAMASAAVGKPLLIGAIDAEWGVLGPNILFSDVSIRSPEDEDILIGAQRVSIRTSLLQLFSKQPLRPVGLAVEGLRLVVEQSESGSLRVRGFSPAESSEEDFLGPLIEFFAAKGDINIGRAEVVWEPFGEDQTTEVSHFDLDFRSGGGRYQINLSGAPPASVAKALDVEILAEGSLADPLGLNGNVLAHVEGLSLSSNWVRPVLANLPIEIKDGELVKGDIEWQWNRDKATKVTSHVDLQKLQLSLPNEDASQRERHLVQAFVGDLSWQSKRPMGNSGDPMADLAGLASRWQLSSDKAILTVAGEPLLVKGLLLDSELSNLRAGEIVGHVREVEFGSVFQEATGLPFPRLVGDALQQLAPSGDLTVDAFKVAFRPKQTPVVTANGQINNLNWNSGVSVDAAAESKGWPGVRGFAGRYKFDDEGLQIAADSHNLSLQWPWLYPDGKQAERMTADIRIAPLLNTNRSVRGLQVTAKQLWLKQQQAQLTADVQVKALFTRPKMTGEINIVGEVEGANTEQVRQFLPAFTPRGVKSWLNSALLAGDVDATFSINGPVAGFPYERNQGQFKVDADISNGRLAFADEWPRLDDVTAKLAFRNVSMTAIASQAKTAGVATDALRVNIPNLRTGEIFVHADTQSTLPSLLRYVRRSPLHAPVADLVQGLTAKGEAGLQLDMTIDAAKPEQLQVIGDLQLNKASFHSSELLQMSDIAGSLSFTRDRVLADDLTGQFHGFPAVANLDLDLNGGDMLITADSHYAPDSNVEQKTFMQDLLPAWFLNTLVGEAALQVDLSGRDGQAPAEKIFIRSDLEGLAVNGPAEISKTATSQAPFSLSIDRSNPEGLEINAAAEGLGGAAIWLADDGEGELRELHRAEFAAGDIQAQLPDTDVIGVVADLPEGNFNRLFDWFAAQSDGGEAETSTPRNLILPDFLDYLALRSNRFNAFGLDWHALNLRIERFDNAALLSMQSAEASGTVRVPDRLAVQDEPTDADEPARAVQSRRLAEKIDANFDYLYLPDLVRPNNELAGTEAANESLPFDPRELPIVSATVADSRYMGVRLGRMLVDTEPSVSGLVLKQLTTRGGRLDIDASGRWDVYGNQHSSEIAVALAAKDWNVVMQGIDLPDVLAAKNASMDIQLQWPNALTHFDMASASGSWSVSFDKGRIYQVEPGIGRVLGLFSFYSLPQRLLLDFSDLASKGLTFDKLSGDFVLNNGEAWTDNLEIRARGADVSIVGRAGLLAQDYDQRVTVRPQISGGTAVVGALVSGVGVGVLLLLGNELLGNPIDELGTLRFHLTGSWDEPLINGEPVAPIAAPKDKPVSNIRFGYPGQR